MEDIWLEQKSSVGHGEVIFCIRDGRPNVGIWLTPNIGEWLPVSREDIVDIARIANEFLEATNAVQ